jgi:hypothetical protein
VYSIRPGLFIGFHGCDEPVRDEVLNGRTHLKPSLNDYDWLGNGIYFWENNAERAFSFIDDLHRNPRKGKPLIKKPSVLGAVFTLGRCLDLLDTQYLELLRESHKTLEIAAKTAGVKLPENKNAPGSSDLLLRYLDCSVIEHLNKRLMPKQFDSVRGVFMEGMPLYPTSGFYDKNHIQISIRNPNCIKGFFLPRKIDTAHSKV